LAEWNGHGENLSLHENGLRLLAFAGDLLILSKTYYSVGGGFMDKESPVSRQCASRSLAEWNGHGTETSSSAD
jgi:L-serine dehydratase